MYFLNDAGTTVPLPENADSNVPDIITSADKVLEILSPIDVLKSLGPAGMSPGILYSLGDQYNEREQTERHGYSW